MSVFQKINVFILKNRNIDVKHPWNAWLNHYYLCVFCHSQPKPFCVIFTDNEIIGDISCQLSDLQLDDSPKKSNILIMFRQSYRLVDLYNLLSNILQ